jgi:hypothetical protein
MARNKVTTDASSLLDAVETIAEEVITEGVPKYEKLLAKLRRAKRGSEAYQDLLSELWVAAEVLKVKAEEAMEVIDEYTETLPD